MPCHLQGLAAACAYKGNIQRAVPPRRCDASTHAPKEALAEPRSILLLSEVFHSLTSVSDPALDPVRASKAGGILILLELPASTSLDVSLSGLLVKVHGDVHELVAFLPLHTFPGFQALNGLLHQLAI